MSDRPDWLLPWFPELREGPPWVTEDMIEAEPELAGIVEDLVEPAAAVGEDLLDATRRGEPIVVLGSGTAEHAAGGLAELLAAALAARGAPGGRVELRESLEAALDPRQGGVVVAVSHGGRTRATVAALDAARAAGARTVLVTADPEAPAAAAADHRLATPLRDRSFCHTVAYVSPLLVGAAIAAAIEQRPLAAAAVRAHLDAALGTREQAGAVAASLHAARQFLCVGGGADTPPARELALKIEEAVRVPATARGLETVLHGHLVAADASTGLVLFLTDPTHRERRVERGEAVLRASRRLGVRTAVVAAPAIAGRFGPELASAGTLVVPGGQGLPGVLASLLSSALALQLLTMGLVREAGVNPDLIRREEAPYREAAELAEAKIR